MLAAVLAMYSTPESPLYRSIGGGLLTVEALKIAGVKASRKSKLGWSVILASSGDRGSCKTIMLELQKQGFKSNEILGAVMAVLPDNLCCSCDGTGTVYSKTGRRWIQCERCKGSGRRKINMASICKRTGTSKERLEAIVNVCLVAKSDAEAAIRDFLRNEKRDLS